MRQILKLDEADLIEAVRNYAADFLPAYPDDLKVTFNFLPAEGVAITADVEVIPPDAVPSEMDIEDALALLDGDEP